MIGSNSGIHFTSASSSLSAIRSAALYAVETSPLELQFHLGEKELRGGVRWVGSMGDDCRILRSPKQQQNERRVSRSAVSLWHKFCCSAPHVELIRQYSLASSVRRSANVANVVNRSSLYFQDSLSQL